VCPTRIEAKPEPIQLDLSEAFAFERGIGRADLLKLAPRLEEAQRQLLAHTEVAKSISSPGAYLDQYKAKRRASLLGQLLGSAKRMRDAVDRAVIVGPPQFIAFAKILYAACCHPYHNELTRGERGGRPRICFAPTDLDNDALQGLLDVLHRDHVLASVESSWGLILIGEVGTSALSAIASILYESVTLNTPPHAETPLAFFIVSPGSHRIEPTERSAFSQTIIAEECDAVPWHPGVLMAASVMGMDIVKLLRGAAALYERFATEPVGNNPPLDLAGLRHLLPQQNTDTYTIEAFDAALVPLAHHFSRGRRVDEQFVVQIISDAVRRDRLRVKLSAEASDQGEPGYLPELTAATAEALRVSRHAASQLTAVIRLPSPDEFSIGQLIQLFLLTEALVPFLHASD
jgi:glucose-6-phosphate isomerase